MMNLNVARIATTGTAAVGMSRISHAAHGYFASDAFVLGRLRDSGLCPFGQCVFERIL